MLQTATPHRRIRRLTAAVCVAVLPAASAWAEKPGDTAPAPPAEPQFDHYVFVPVSPNADVDPDPFTGHRSEDNPPDPRIIPFSNWQFRGPNGEWQPWRKRSELYRERDNGQAGGVVDCSLRIAWTLPPDIEYVRAVMDEVAGWGGPNAATGLVRGGSLRYTTTSGGRYHIQRPYIDSMDLLQDTLHSRMLTSRGEWETVATAHPGDAFPVGDDDFSIEYFGELRPDGAVNEVFEMFGGVDTSMELEIHTKENYDNTAWRYRIRFFDNNNEECRQRSSTSTRQGNERFRVSSIAPGDIARAEIQRDALSVTEFDPIDLSLLTDLPPNELDQRRIEITPAHRFGEPARVVLDPYDTGAKCLLDLDSARAIAFPDAELDDTALAMYYEEHEVDLRMRVNDEGDPLIDPIACGVYMLNAGLWDESPAACIASVRGDRHSNRLSNQAVADGAPLLVTTCDGAMVLLRIAEVLQVGKDGPVQAVVEVRRLVEP